MEKLLKSGLINLSALGAQMYPEKTKTIAGSLLRMKINRVNGNRLSEEERGRVCDIIKKYSKTLDLAYFN
jgi:hypothetical protein